MNNTNGMHFEALIEEILENRYKDSALLYEKSSQLLEQAQAIGDIYSIAFAQTYLADYYIAKQDTRQSFLYLRRAEATAREHNYLDLLKELCCLCALYYEALNDEQTSFDYYLEALEYCVQSHDITGICRSYNNLSSLFQYLHSHPIAIEYGIKAYNSAKSLDFERREAYLQTILHNLIVSHLALNHLEEARHYFELAIEHNPSHSSARATLRITEILLLAAEGRSEEALPATDRLLSGFLEEVEGGFEAFELLLPLAEAMVNLGQPAYLERVLNMLEQTSQTDAYAHYQELLSLRIEFYQMTGNKEALYATYEEYYRVQSQSHLLTAQNKASSMLLKLDYKRTMHEKKLLEKTARELESMVFVDPLTSLSNRRSLDNLLEVSLLGNSTHQLGIIMLDIDHFKQHNDCYGHPHGDCTLQQLAAILLEEKTENIYPCRYGGDEFCCVCINQTDQEIEHYITQVMQSLSKKQISHTLLTSPTGITISVGYANAPIEQISDAKALHAAADTALYRAKQQGRNCWFRAGSLTDVEQAPSIAY